MLLRIFFTLSVLVSLFVGADARTMPHGRAYGGVGVCLGNHEIDSRDPGFHLSFGMGRVYSQLNEVVARGCVMIYGEKSKEGLNLPVNLRAYAAGLDLKWNFGDNSSPERPYLFLSSGALGMYIGESWTSDAYLGGGFGLHSGSGRKTINIEVRWLQGIGHSLGEDARMILLTLGVAI